MANWLAKYSTLPVWTMKFGDLAVFYQQRMARDQCNIAGVVLFGFSLRYVSARARSLPLIICSRMHSFFPLEE